MCKKGEITFRKKQYYRIAEEGLTSSIKTLTDKVNEINQGNKKDSLSYFKQQLNTVVHLLTDKEYLKKKAEEYAKIDLDEVDENYRKTFLLFTSGKVSEANSIVNTNVILKNIELSKKKSKKASEDYKSSYKPLYLKADILQILGSVDSARILYEYAANYDSTNYESVLRLIYFFKSQREYKKANKWTENLKFTDLTNLLVRDATYYYILGDNSIIQHKNRLARKALEKAKSLYLKIHPINQNTIIEYNSFMATLDEKLAYIYRSQGNTDLAIPLLLNSLKINQDLVIRDSTLLFNLSNSYTELGKVFFQDFQDESSHKAYFYALKISRRILKVDSSIINLNNLLNILRFTANLYARYSLDSAILKLDESVKIGQLLVSKNKIYEEELAECYHAIGVIYCDNDKYDLAEIPLSKALTIREELVRFDSLAHASRLANTINTIGLRLIKSVEIPNSEALVYLNRGLKIRKILFENEPESNVGDYFKSLTNICNYYMKINKTDSAFIYEQKAYNILIPFTEKNDYQICYMLITSSINYAILCKNNYSDIKDKKYLNNAISRLEYVKKMTDNLPLNKGISQRKQFLIDMLIELNNLKNE